MKKLLKKHKSKLVLTAATFVVLAYIGQGTLSKKTDFELKKSPSAATASPTPQESSFPTPPAVQNNGPQSPITGTSCENPTRRPIAVMIASDREARPLSGLSEADMVFEMPVVTDSITRLMAVFGCSTPEEVGSVRSARHNFIDLASGVNAVYAHWGGSHFALDRLKTGVINDIDALSNPFETFYRKRGIPQPHNGFTNGGRLINAVQKLGFNLEDKFEGYPHESAGSVQQAAAKNGKLTIGYPGEFRVEYQYDSATNLYLRWRGGTKEIDKNNNQQVGAKNVAVMYAVSKQIEGQYNDVKVTGQGKAEFYLNGEKIDGSWRKDAGSPSSKLYFLDNSGSEIKFVPGNIWVEVIQINQTTEWTSQ